MASDPVDTSKAAEFWRGNLDPQNLDQSAQKASLPLETEIAFQETPDHCEAFEWLRGAFAADESPIVVDLGAGLGALSLWMARRGARVIAVDSSVERLRELRRRAREAGCAERVMTVAGSAEALPFARGALRGVLTKSVLIHTDLERAADEIARVLAEGGRAALDEPQPGNPFAWLYRNTLAPKEWKGITRYFAAAEQRIFMRAIGGGSGGRVAPFYFFSFLAFIFQFALPRPALFFPALRVLRAADRILFAVIPLLRRCAWFGLILVKKKSGASRD